MPELPDVEVFRRYLDSTALHKTITEVEVETARILEGVSKAKLQKALTGRQFQVTHRHGKHLLAAFDKDAWLTFHFGMTGFLKYFKQMDQEPEHDRLLISFDNEYHLAYVSQRKLGAVGLTDDVEDFVEEKELGPDALRIDLEGLRQVIKGKRGSIKSFLMNQKHLAGIGNIYSDEILFQSRLHPKAEVNNLARDTVEQLYQAMQDVLRGAIAAQADPERFPKAFLIPHRHPGGTCPRCRGEVKKISISGRSGYFCPACQGKPN